MQVKVELLALYIIQQLQQNGYDVYIVGGAVRDLLLNQVSDQPHSVTDYDFTTNAKPEEIQAVFPENFYENTFGTVSITQAHVAKKMGVVLPTPEHEPNEEFSKVIDLAQATKIHESLTLASRDDQEVTPASSHLADFQITTYRADELYDDHRRPTFMTWGTSLEQDLERRDFTINAMALSFDSTLIKQSLVEVSEQSSREIEIEAVLVDPFGGHKDVKKHLIKAVGNPMTRFQEDALRMLRAIRFAVQLNFTIESNTFEAILKSANLIEHISAERIRDEFLKVLASPYPAEGVELLDETGLLAVFLPELEAGKGVEQGGHHTTDVWTHSLDALRYCPSPDPIVRLATLLHDVGKPVTQRYTNDGITFYNHEIVGAKMARSIAQRLKLRHQDIEKVYTLVRFHMFYYQPHNTDAAIRRFMRSVGLENIDDILALREGDRLGSGARHTSWRLEEMKQRMQAQLHQPMDIKDLAINGQDLMTELHLAPGPKIGLILKTLLEKVFEEPDLNQKQKLLEIAHSLT